MHNYWLLALLLCSGTALGGDFAKLAPGQSKFEFGIGLGLLNYPDYLGSSRSNVGALPLPYIRYRGERLRVDDGIEGRLFNTPDLLLSLSGNGSPPSNSDNPERAGMGKVDATMELGPSLEYRIDHDDSSSLWLEIPLRYAFNLEKSLNVVGRVLNPRLAWRWPAQSKYAWKRNASAGPLFADANYLGFLYNVDPSQATATRPAYSASAGYSGFRVSLSASRRIGKLWFGAFLRGDSLNGAEIENSPLVTQSENLTAGLALAWVFDEHN